MLYIVGKWTCEIYIKNGRCGFQYFTVKNTATFYVLENELKFTENSFLYIYRLFNIMLIFCLKV